METTRKEIQSKAISFAIKKDGQQIARASLFIITSEVGNPPYGLLEDVFVHEDHRGQGYGKQVVNLVIEEAKNQGCRKIRGTSRKHREEVHAMYEKMGFEKYGYAFKYH